MGTPFIGEIRMAGFNFAPAGWAFCDGALLPIAENDALFSLIGTTYGGDGQTTFALPDLRGRIPLHSGTLAGGSSYQLGEVAGVETVTLTTNQIPAHTHMAQAGGYGNTDSPAGAFFSASASIDVYSPNASNVSLNPAAIQLSGGSQPHDNMPPYLVVNFIISLFGIYPSQA